MPDRQAVVQWQQLPGHLQRSQWGGVGAYRWVTCYQKIYIAEHYMLPFSQAQRTRIHQFGTHCRLRAEAGPTLWGQTVWGQNARVASLTNGDIEMHIGHLTKRCHMLINRTIKSLQARHLSTGNMTYASYWLYVGITCKLKRWQVNECGGLMCLLREVYFVICDTFMLHTLLSFDNWVPVYSTFPSE